MPEPLFKKDDLVDVEFVGGEAWLAVGQAGEDFPSEDGSFDLYFPLDADVLDHHAYDAPNGGPFPGVIEGALLTFVRSESDDDLWQLADSQQTRFDTDEPAKFRMTPRRKDGQIPQALLDRLASLAELIRRY